MKRINAHHVADWLGAAIIDLAVQRSAASGMPPGRWLADRTGLHERYVQRRLDGARGFTTDDVAVICAALGVTEAQLYADATAIAESTRTH